jgi:hypothetical protein
MSLTGNLAAGCLSVHLTLTPGSDNWQFTNVTGAVASDQLTDTQVGYLNSKNVNYCQTIDVGRVLGGGVDVYGEYCDKVRGLDWWYATAQANIINAMLQAAPKKIPYTDAGVQRAVVGPLMQTNKQGVDNGLITNNPAPTISVQAVKDVPAATRETRNFPDVAVTFTLAGAINFVDPINVSVLV